MIQSTVLKLKDIWNTYKTSKVMWGVIIIVAVIILLIAKKSNDTTGQITAIVERRDVVDEVVLSGRTESASAVSLGFADTGRVHQVLVTEGDHVSKGQLLASIDTSDLYTDDLSKIIREQDALVANAYRNLLSSSLVAIPEDLTNPATPPLLSGVYAGPEGDYRLRIYASGSESGKSFELSGLEKEFNQPVTMNTTVPLGSRGLYIQFQSIPDIGYWVISIPNKRSTSYASYVNAYESAKATRDRVIADAQASNESVISKMNKRRIYAPFSGTVASVGIKKGASTDGKETIKLISEKDYQITLKAPEVSVAKLQLGQTVSVGLDAYGKDVSFPAKIVSINPAETIIDGVPVYETKVMFDSADSRIRSGMTAIATITIQEQKGVLAIPANLIYEENGTTVVFVMHDDKKEMRVIQTGIRGSDSYREIISGLSEGETVVSK